MADAFDGNADLFRLATATVFLKPSRASPLIFAGSGRPLQLLYKPTRSFFSFSVIAAIIAPANLCSAVKGIKDLSRVAIGCHRSVKCFSAYGSVAGKNTAVKEQTASSSCCSCARMPPQRPSQGFISKRTLRCLLLINIKGVLIRARWVGACLCGRARVRCPPRTTMTLTV